MESRGKKEERQGTEAEGKAKEGTPSWGRRARNRQRRRDLWYDEGDQTKTSEPKKGRRAPLYHTTRARDAPGLHKPPDTGLGLERDRQRRMQDHAPPVRREARPALRDLEARIPARGNRGSRPGPEGQATAQVRGIRPLQGPGRDQRQQREQGDQDAGDDAKCDNAEVVSEETYNEAIGLSAAMENIRWQLKEIDEKKVPPVASKPSAFGTAVKSAAGWLKRGIEDIKSSGDDLKSAAEMIKGLFN